MKACYTHFRTCLAGKSDTNYICKLATGHRTTTLYIEATQNHILKSWAGLELCDRIVSSAGDANQDDDHVPPFCCAS